MTKPTELTQFRRWNDATDEHGVLQEYFHIINIYEVPFKSEKVCDLRYLDGVISSLWTLSYITDNSRLVNDD